LIEKRDEVDYRFLASTTGSSISISITYIVFLTEMQKRQRYSRLRKEHLWHFYRFDAFGGGRDRGVFINKAAGMKSQMHLKFLELTKNKGGPFRPPLWRSCEDKLTRH